MEKEMSKILIQQIAEFNINRNKRIELNIQLFQFYLSPSMQLFINGPTKEKAEIRNALLCAIENLSETAEAQANLQFMSTAAILKGHLEVIKLT